MAAGVATHPNGENAGGMHLKSLSLHHRIRQRDDERSALLLSDASASAMEVGQWFNATIVDVISDAFLVELTMAGKLTVGSLPFHELRSIAIDAADSDLFDTAERFAGVVISVRVIQLQPLVLTEKNDTNKPVQIKSFDVREMGPRYLVTLTLEQKRSVLPSCNLEGIADRIRNGRSRKVVFMAGAGISVSAGIPDFRTPGTGLYYNTAKYNCEPHQLFDSDFFRCDPRPLFSTTLDITPGNQKPTPSHVLMKLFHEYGILQRVYTQNLDQLEAAVGLPRDKVVHAHGSFETTHCSSPSCMTEYAFEDFYSVIQKGGVPVCYKCKTFIRPAIILMGEDLPERFYKLYPDDFASCDLLIIMGTSLEVRPFANLQDMVPPNCPRLLINRNPVGRLRYECNDNYRDVFAQGDSDDCALELVQLLGWERDFEQATAALSH